MVRYFIHSCRGNIDGLHERVDSTENVRTAQNRNMRNMQQRAIQVICNASEQFSVTKVHRPILFGLRGRHRVSNLQKKALRNTRMNPDGETVIIDRRLQSELLRPHRVALVRRFYMCTERCGRCNKETFKCYVTQIYAIVDIWISVTKVYISNVINVTRGSWTHGVS